MPLRGNVGEIDRMASEVERMGNGLVRRVAREGKAEIARELDRTIKARQAPTGEPWAPRKDRRPLADWSNAVSVAASEDKISARAPGFIPTLHEYGTRSMVERKLIPKPEEALPPSWKLALERAVARAVAFFTRSRS